MFFFSKVDAKEQTDLSEGVPFLAALYHDVWISGFLECDFFHRVGTEIEVKLPSKASEVRKALGPIKNRYGNMMERFN